MLDITSKKTESFVFGIFFFIIELNVFTFNFAISFFSFPRSLRFLTMLRPSDSFSQVPFTIGCEQNRQILRAVKIFCRIPDPCVGLTLMRPSKPRANISSADIILGSARHLSYNISSNEVDSWRC